MASVPDNHPSEPILQAYGQGRLPPDEAARLEEHLAACPLCGEKLGQVEDDTYSELLRDRATGVPLHENPTLADTGSDFPELPVELRTHNRYTILRRIGMGGMGVVYEAVHKIMRRPVALKIIRPDLVATPLAVSRFRREVQSAARLAHPNIVTAYDAEEVAGVHFLVMEFVKGQSLDEVVQQRGPLPLDQACAAVRQTAQGLAHAHAQGMTHRDIKPANLMLTPEGTVKILDFGLAGWSTPVDAPASPSLTQFGVQLGTPHFAAPEQFESAQQADARADQYGLGATLLFLLGGKPLPSETHSPASRFTLPESVPAGAKAILDRLMALHPEDRFPSMEAVVHALTPWCPGGPPPTTARSSSLDVRRPLIGGAMTAVTVLLALLGFTIFGLFGRNQGEAPPPQTLPVLFLLPSRGLWYEDYRPAREVLDKSGLRVVIATPGGVPSRLQEISMLGKPNRPDMVPADTDLMDLELHRFSAIVCMGYEHAEFTSGDTPTSDQAMRLLRLANRAEMPIVGICAGQTILGAAGILQGKRVARQSDKVGDLAELGALPQPDHVVVRDGHLITASTPQESAAAAIELVQALEDRK